MVTFMSVPRGGRRICEDLGEFVERVLAHRDVQEVSVLADEVLACELSLAGPRHGDETEAVPGRQAAEWVPGPRVGEGPLQQHDLAAGLGPLGDRVVLE